MTMSHKKRSVKIFLRAFLPQKPKAPAIAGALVTIWILLCYSFKELGSEVFFGDFRLR